MLGNVTFDGKHLEFLDLLSITTRLPCSVSGQSVFLGWFRGKDLDKDEAFQKFISVPETVSTRTAIPRRCWIKLPKSNWLAM